MTIVGRYSKNAALVMLGGSLALIVTSIYLYKTGQRDLANHISDIAFVLAILA